MANKSLVPVGAAAPRPRLDDPVALGSLLAESGFFADAREMAQAVTKILAGRELGVGALASMNGIFVVKGRITLSANLIASLIKRSGRYDYRVRCLDHERCTITFFEGGEPVGESTFTREDAVRAGIAHGDNWKHYPRNMLFARALSNGAKWFCPDLFVGPVYTPDEVGGAVDGATGEPLVDPRTGNVLPDPNWSPSRLTVQEVVESHARWRFLQNWRSARQMAGRAGIVFDPLDEERASDAELEAAAHRLKEALTVAREVGWTAAYIEAARLGLGCERLAADAAPEDMAKATRRLRALLAERRGRD